MNKVSILKYIFIILISAVTSFLYGKLFLEAITKLTLTDFHVYYYVPKMVITEKSPMFPYINFSPIYPYFFPPGSIPILFTLSFIPLYLAKIIWTIINFILLIFSLFFILKSLKIYSKLNLILALLAAFFYYPIIFTIRDGQFNIILLFIFSYALFEVTVGKFREVLSLPLALGIISKISPGIILIYLFFKKKYKLIFTTSVLVLIFMLLAEIYVQPKINYLYFKNVISQVSAQSTGLGFSDQSLLSLVKKINADFGFKLSSLTLNIINYSFVLILFSLYFYFEKNSSKKINPFREHLNIVLLAFISVTGTGLVWFHQYSILFMPWLVMFLISILFLKKHRIYFVVSYCLIYFLWAFDLREYPLPFPYLNMNMFWAGLWFVINTFILKAYPEFFSEKPVFNLENKFTDYKHTFTLTCLASFLIGINIWNLNEILKEARDFTRVTELNYMGKKLVKSNMKFQTGTSNSYIKNNRLDRGYILLEKDEFKKLIHAMPVLYFDLVNNEEFNYRFSSNDGKSFELSARLESKKYISEYGTDYSFKYNLELGR